MVISDGFLVTWFEECHLEQRWFADERDAWALIADRGRSFDERHGTLADFADLVWLPHHLERYSAVTLKKYGQVLRQALLPVLGRRPLRDLGEDTIRSYLADCRAAGVCKSSLKQRAALLRSMRALAASRFRV
jgi:hypothetical protein